MTIGVIALASERIGKKVLVADSRGDQETSSNIMPLVNVILSDYDNEERQLKYIKVCWDLIEFTTPIFNLLPTQVKMELMKYGKVEFETDPAVKEKCKLFYIPNKMLGITVKWRTHKSGNFYEEHIVEDNVYEIEDFYQNTVPVPKTVDDTEYLGCQLLDNLNKMGMFPTKLISPANVLEECVLSTLTFVNIFRLPKDGLPLAEACLSTMTDEWRQIFKGGNFKEAHSYDLSACYPSIIAQLPNLYNAEFGEFNGESDGWDWGMLEGDLSLDCPYTPFKEGQPLTTEQVEFIRLRKLGKFKCRKAYYIKINRNDKPFEYIMHRLFEYRGQSDLRNTLSKRMSNSLYGKVSQMNDNGKYGDYFQPIYAKMITSRASLKVCQFILDNHVEDNLISVEVDGVILDKMVKVGTIRRFGQWRYNGTVTVRNDKWQAKVGV